MLLRAVADLAGIDPCHPDQLQLVVRELVSRDWASVTLTGARHELMVALAGDPDHVASAMARILSELPDREIPIHGHFVAELAVAVDPDLRDDGHGLTIHALVIRD
ncbi:hypothetical protein [Sandarakinorhabdus sp.]|uniref:hypothetical protein n=1 Tax=Sandarakinorhabdus sp. TaxID=1916663 RepID=UPI00286E68B5|nr:hypothetical protein [Sandarakinorhabdus sp.]